MVFANVLSYVLVLIGALNWGLYGIFGFNLVGWIFQGPRSVGSIIIYVLVALSAIWLVISPIISGWGLRLKSHEMNSNEKHPETEIE